MLVLWPHISGAGLNAEVIEQPAQYTGAGLVLPGVSNAQNLNS